MSVVAVGIDLEDGGPALFVGALDGVPSFGPDFIEVLTIDDVPIDVVALGAFGQTGFARGGTGQAGAHGILVVFDDVDHRDVPERSEVEGLVVDALVDCTIAEVGEATTLEALVFEGVGNAEAERGLSGHNSVAAPEIFIRREKVHRAPLPFRTSGGFAEKFGHALVH